MAREDRIIRSMKELRRAHMLHQGLEGTLRQVRAAAGCRIVKRVRREGDRGVAHQSRGRRSNRVMETQRNTRVLRRDRTRSTDVGPTVARDKLLEREGSRLSEETWRGWLKSERGAYPQRKKRPHRTWRERKQQCGEVMQMDAQHGWLEACGGSLCPDGLSRRGSRKGVCPALCV